MCFISKIVFAQEPDFGQWILPGRPSLTNIANCLKFLPSGIDVTVVNNTLTNEEDYFVNSYGIFDPGGSLIFYTIGPKIFKADNSANYKRTYLQTAGNGNIYGVSNDGWYLGEIAMPGGTFSPNVLNLSVISYYEISAVPFYVLPEDMKIYHPLALNVDTVTYVTCPGGNDGSISVTPSGGVPEYIFTWSKEVAPGEWVLLPYNTNTATGLTEGTYKCCVTDHGGGFGAQTVCVEVTVEVNPNLFTHGDNWWFVESTPPNPYTENWSFKYGIWVKNNSTLTLNNCYFQFAKDAKVIIEPGSKIIMNNTTFTYLEACEDMWKGVEVWGQRDSSQYFHDGHCDQGTLIMNNNSVIRYAIWGARTFKPTDFSTTGGIVQATNSYFTNNKYSVEFMPYSNWSLNGHNPAPNLSYFSNCTFNNTSGYLVEYPFVTHFYMYGVNGIRIRGCTFDNAVYVPSGKAIQFLNSGFIVEAICTYPEFPCPNPDKTLFTGYERAIDGSGSLYTIIVKESEFHANTTGIRLNGVNYATILLNEFYIGTVPEDGGGCDEGEEAAGFGIDMNRCNGFAIEENYFTKEQGALSNYVGIRIAETQATDQVYKNTFTGLSYGNYAVGKNWKGINTSQGLAYYCNENTNNWQDFYVDTLYNDESGIQNPIGGISLPAGNTFSPTATWHINNKGDYHIGYFYYEPTNGDTNTVFYPNTDKVWKVTREGVYLYENECLSHYGGGGGGGTGRGLVLTPGEKQETEQEYYENLDEYNNVKSLYDYLKDGGNTQLTISEVETAFPNDMWELRAGLLEKSPHLTTDVLKKTADRTDVFPDNVIFEIMAANPDELRKGELIKYLAEKENPLPEYMLTVLRQVLETGITYKTILIGNMAHFNNLKTRATHDMIRSILNDTVTDVVELRTWLGRLGGKRADEQIIASYMEEENHSQALSLANALPQAYDYDENELIEHGYYMDMLNLMNTLNQQGRTVFELDSTEVTNLVYIAENTKGTASAQAKGILEYAYGYHFCDCINADSTGYKSSGSFNPGNYGHAYGISITAGPNPATDWVAFDYSLNDDNATGYIKITDVAGKPVTTLPVTDRQGQKIWDTRQVSPGVYFYTFSALGANKSGKIVVSK